MPKQIYTIKTFHGMVTNEDLEDLPDTTAYLCENVDPFVVTKVQGARRHLPMDPDGIEDENNDIIIILPDPPAEA